MRNFVECETFAHPTAVIQFADLLRRFVATLPEAERGEWTRLRAVVEATKAGLELAHDGRQIVVVGRSFYRAGKRLSVRGGRLVRTPALV